MVKNVATPTGRARHDRDPQNGANNQGSKHLWVVNHYSMLPSKDGSTSRHLELARRMEDEGWSTTLITASTRHPSGEQSLTGSQIRRISTEDNIKALWVRTKAYDRNPRFRALGMLIFALNALAPGITRGLQRPDAIMGCTVHPFAALAGSLLARRHKVPFIYEIRDVWPDTLIDLGAISPNGLSARLLRGLSRLLIRNAALVVSPLPFIQKHLDELEVSATPTSWVPNGFHSPGELEPLRELEDPFTFMYLGSHGNANALDGLIEAFNRACQFAPELSLKMMLVGDGPAKRSLQETASSLPFAHLIFFEDRVPSDQVLARAREADCLVANVLDKPVYRFGVSPNKFFLYLAAGRPVIIASSAPNNPVEDAGAGLTVRGDDRSALAEAMIKMARMSKSKRAAMAAAGPPEITNNYSYEILATRLAGDLESAISRFDFNKQTKESRPVNTPNQNESRPGAKRQLGCRAGRGLPKAGVLTRIWKT